MLHFISVKISLVVDVKNHQGKGAINRKTDKGGCRAGVKKITEIRSWNGLG